MLPAIAAAALGGSILSFIGQERANAANRSMANAQMAFQGESQREAMDFNREMVGRQETFQRDSASTAMDFARTMSDTAYQRGMADMRAAGLNPILAYKQGGATTPAGVSPSGASASISPLSGASAVMGNSLGPAVATAVQASKVVQELQQQAANIEQTRAQTALIGDQQLAARASTALDTARAVSEGYRPEHIRAVTRTEQGRPALVGAQTAAAGSSARYYDQRTITEQEMPFLRRAEAHRATEQGNVSRVQAHHLNTYGPPHMISGAVGSLSQIINSVRQSLQ